MAESAAKLAAELFKNGMRFNYLKWRGKPAKPQAISIEITHRCIAKCIMCNIWKIPAHIEDLSMNIWNDLLSNTLFTDLRELDITGGEPFLRKDLADLFSNVCRLKQSHLKSLRSIAVTTNGILTERVLNDTAEIVPRLEAANLDLVMVCAMDAIGTIHDKIRNYEGAWSKVDRTIKGLMGLKKKFANLIVGLKTTIVPDNITELKKIVQYANSNDLFTIISPCIITEGRYLNVERDADLRFGAQDLDQMIRFYESELFRWSYHAKTLVTYFRTGKMRKPCSCGYNYFFIRSNGDLFLCPLVNIRMGNIKKNPISHLFHSKTASEVRRKIGRYPQCRQCTEPGLERYALPFEGFTYLWLLMKMGKERFLQLHRHMGLDKYLD